MIRWCVDSDEYLAAVRHAAGQHAVTIEGVNYLPVMPSTECTKNLYNAMAAARN